MGTELPTQVDVEHDTSTHGISWLKEAFLVPTNCDTLHLQRFRQIRQT